MLTSTILPTIGSFLAPLMDRTSHTTDLKGSPSCSKIQHESDTDLQIDRKSREERCKLWLRASSAVYKGGVVSFHLGTGSAAAAFTTGFVAPLLSPAVLAAVSILGCGASAHFYTLGLRCGNAGDIITYIAATWGCSLSFGVAIGAMPAGISAAMFGGLSAGYLTAAACAFGGISVLCFATAVVTFAMAVHLISASSEEGGEPSPHPTSINDH